MKDKHPAKLKLARKMMTQAEIKAGISPFNSKAWNDRKEARAAEVIRRNEKSKSKT